MELGIFVFNLSLVISLSVMNHVVIILFIFVSTYKDIRPCINMIHVCIEIFLGVFV